MSHTRARAGVGIQQGQGQGGIQYPLLHPSADVYWLLADAYLAYRDNTQSYKLPFHIRYLYGFGSDSATVPITPVNTHEAEIIDDEGTVVFDSLTATGFKSIEWDTRLRLLEWIDPDGQILRLAYHTEWPDGVDVVTYPEYLEPESAELQSRVLDRLPRMVTSLKVGDTVLSFPDGVANFVLKNGYNTTLQAEATVTGVKRQTKITLAAEPGSGEGRYGGCDESEDPIIRRINGQTADSAGNFLLDATGCHRIEKIVLETRAPGDGHPFSRVTVRSNALQVTNDCEPCCSCTDFINVYEALRRLRDTYAGLSESVQSIRDLYHENLARFLEAKDCRENRKLRTVLLPFCDGRVGVAAGFCNTTDACLRNVVIPVSFEYTGIGDDTLVAETTATFDQVIPGTVFRIGNTPVLKAKNDARQEPYKLIGDYPHFFAHFDAVDPGVMAYVSFFAAFSGTTTDKVSIVTDAYLLSEPPAYDSGTAIPGYTPGTGPTGVIDAEHLVDGPNSGETGLLQCE